MADQELVIKINGDVSNLEKSLESVKGGVSNLSSSLGSIAKGAAASYAVLNGAILGLVAGYREGEQVAFQTQVAIDATGKAATVTAEKVGEMALKWQDLTTYEDDAIQSGENVLLSFRNIANVTDQMTGAMLDLSTGMGIDATSAARVLGKALDSPIEGLGALSKAGIRFTEAQKKQIEVMVQSNNIAGAQSIILRAVEGRFEGAAKAAAQGTGAFVQMQNVFKNIADEIGKNLAPGMIKTANGIKEVLVYVREHPIIAKMAANFLLVGSAVSGIIAVATGATVAFLTLRTALTAAGISTGALTLSMRTLIGSTGIGLVLVAITDLALNFDKRTKEIQIIWKAFSDNIGAVGAGLANILVGVSTLNIDKVSAGLDKIKEATFKTWDEIKEGVVRTEMEAQEETKEAALSGMTQTNDEKIALANEHNEELKRINLEAAEERLGIKLSDDEANIERQALVDELENDAALTKLNAEIDRETDHRAKLRLMNEREDLIDTKREESLAKRRSLTAKQRMEMDAQVNQALTDGAFAVAGALVSASSMSAKNQFVMQQALGIAQVLINGYMAASLAMATIPPPGGEIIAAQRLTLSKINAAAIGAVGMINYTAMKEGGIVTGGIPGRDSVPIMAMQGELMSPVANFEEVIGSVRAKREADKLTAEEKYTNENTKVDVDVVISLKGDASKMFEAQRQQRISIGTLRG